MEKSAHVLDIGSGIGNVMQSFIEKELLLYYVGVGLEAYGSDAGLKISSSRFALAGYSPSNQRDASSGLWCHHR
mgnify:CR=1 FL=1